MLQSIEPLARVVVPHSYETGISISPMWQVNPGNIDILSNSLLWGAVLGTSGCLLAFQSSAHSMPEAPLTLPGHDTQKCLQ